MSSEMMKIASLSGVNLDYAVTAYVLKYPLIVDFMPGGRRTIFTNIRGVQKQFSPSSFWSEAGPLIQQFGVSLICGTEGKWTAWVEESSRFESSDPIEAALRALVSHKNPGTDEVECPVKFN
ncbi:hypothetical protein D3C76_482370 [compost metagenome]